ncbi:MAG: DUF3795 domain-containing protein [Promethearchaeota archaeon]
MGMMEEKISFCGLDCLSCPAYIATQHGDRKALERIAIEWSNNELKFDSKNIDCVGCTEDGRHFSWCDICPIRKCGMGKKIKNCAHCIYYPCEELNQSLKNSFKARQKLDDIRKNL